MSNTIGKVGELAELRITPKLPVPRRKIHPPHFKTVVLGAAILLSRERRKSDANRAENGLW